MMLTEGLAQHSAARKGIAEPDDPSSRLIGPAQLDQSSTPKASHAHTWVGSGSPAGTPGTVMQSFAANLERMSPLRSCEDARKAHAEGKYVAGADSAGVLTAMVTHRPLALALPGLALTARGGRCWELQTYYIATVQRAAVVRKVQTSLQLLAGRSCSATCVTQTIRPP
jgi:hypothetical protein